MQENRHRNPKNQKPKIVPPIKFIGQGAYGCVFRPFVQCIGSNKPTNLQYISKIQRNTTDIQNEVECGRLVYPLPLSKLFFAPIVDTCPVSISAIPKTEIQKCDIFTKSLPQYSEAPITEYISSKIRYYGKNEMTKYLLSISKNTKKVIRRLLAFHIHILRGIQLLHTLESPIIHNDIKDGNTIYDEKHGNPVLIDFGLSYQVKDITPEMAPKIFYTYEMYTPWCFDVTLLSYISRGIIGQNINIESTYITDMDLVNINELFEKFIRENELFNPELYIFSKEETDTFRQQYHQFLASFLNKTWKAMFDELVKNALMWDNYSTTVMFLITIYDIFLSDNPDLIHRILQTKTLSPNDRMVNWLKSYLQILKSCILIVPSSPRTAINETIESVTKLTQSVNKNELLSFVTFIMKADNTKKLLQNYHKNNYKRKESSNMIRELKTLVSKQIAPTLVAVS
jgi:serine/threonine protein kinase